MLIPVCRATDTMPRRTTLLHAIPSRTDPRSTRGHVRDPSRARVPDVTRADGHETCLSQCALIRLATSMKHGSIILEPYQAHASHKPARIGSSYALCRVSVFVSVRRFDEDSTDRCLGVVRFFLREFDSMGQLFLIRAYSLVSWCPLAMPRLMASVSRMGLCGSLFVVRHSLCQLVSFFNAEFVFFFQTMSLRTPCDKFQL